MKDRQQKKLSILLFFLGVVVSTTLFAEGPANAFDAGAFFKKQCSSCHTVGQGDDIGPDLKGVTERRPEAWLIRFIQSSQDLINSGDPIANELFNKYKRKKMPDHDLSPDEVKKILQLITEGGPKEAPLDNRVASEATGLHIKLGEDLFLGKTALFKGGPPCISCHTVADYGSLGGGALGPNLSRIYSKYEDRGLTKALARTGFPVMREIYSNRPLSTEEAFAIKAFLYKVDQSGELGGDYQKKFLFLGLGGTAFAMGLIDFIWRRRRKKTIKPRQGGTT